jgi:antitoxin component of RelBE/YafQ-DinJ toxin-antitoxin module
MENVLAKAKDIAEDLGLKLSAVNNVTLGGVAVGLTVYAVVVTLILFV